MCEEDRAINPGGPVPVPANPDTVNGVLLGKCHKALFLSTNMLMLSFLAEPHHVHDANGSFVEIGFGAHAAAFLDTSAFPNLSSNFVHFRQSAYTEIIDNHNQQSMLYILLFKTRGYAIFHNLIGGSNSIISC